jgi:hypothetical protein
MHASLRAQPGRMALNRTPCGPRALPPTFGARRAARRAGPAPAPARAAAPGGDAGAGSAGPHGTAPAPGGAPEHAPMLLLLAQARLAALEDFRALAARLHASPLQGGAGAADPAEALLHAARFASPSLEAEDVMPRVQALADAVALRAAEIVAAEASAEAAAARAAAAGQDEDDEARGRKRRRRAGVGFAPDEADLDAAPSSSGPGGWGADSRRRAEAGAAARLRALAGVMADEGFRLNEADPFDPDNTYLDRLLARRLGEQRPHLPWPPWIPGAPPAGRDADVLGVGRARPTQEGYYNLRPPKRLMSERLTSTHTPPAPPQARRARSRCCGSPSRGARGCRFRRTARLATACC